MVFPDTEKWQTLLNTDNKYLNKANPQIHHATQFIAILGKYLLKEKPDDSHINAEWLQDHELLAGNWIKGKKLFRLAFDIKNFSLVFLDNEIKKICSIELNGKTRMDVFNWIKTEATNLGKDGSKLKLKMHYEIPDNDIVHGTSFTNPGKETLEELSKLRHNAHIIFSFIASKFKNSGTVKVWPFRFDSSCIVPVKKDNKGNLQKSIGLGMAVPDNIANEYYFYVSPWSSVSDIDFDTLPDLNNYGKWHIHGWNGAYLPISEVMKSENKEKQVEIVNGFLISAIDACLFLLDSTELFSKK